MRKSRVDLGILVGRPEKQDSVCEFEELLKFPRRFKSDSVEDTILDAGMK